VYGREQPIPLGNLFVAGTSCKDFSMLKTTRRKDIEDKGQSGQTFMAAVEFLDLYKPPFAIFENVDGAPWTKMQMYIEGRIDLASRNDFKGITVTDKKKQKSKPIAYFGTCRLVFLRLSSLHRVSLLQRLRKG
jgi:site-specific DNA-cytosine methylase